MTRYNPLEGVLIGEGTLRLWRSSTNVWNVLEVLIFLLLKTRVLIQCLIPWKPESKSLLDPLKLEWCIRKILVSKETDQWLVLPFLNHLNYTFFKKQRLPRYTTPYVPGNSSTLTGGLTPDVPWPLKSGWRRSLTKDGCYFTPTVT